MSQKRKRDASISSSGTNATNVQHAKALPPAIVGEEQQHASHTSLSIDECLVSSSASFDNTSELCERCQTIDFETAFHINIPWRESRAVFVFPPNVQHWRSSCPLCRKGLKQVLRAYHASSVADWDGNDPPVIGNILIADGRASTTAGHRFLQHAVNDTWLLEGRSQNEVTGNNQANRAVMKGTILLRSRFSGQFVKDALEACRRHHDCATSPLHPPEQLQVIDCVSGRIESLPAGEPYITLSYVWGGAKPTAAEAKFIQAHRHLPENVPRTLKDAMKVVLRPEHRYIWIDRYCIDQYHSQHKASQIASMADIYESSLFTLIALGPDAHSGIAGISKDFDPQVRFTLRGATYVSSGHRLQYHIKKSAWVTRGWVYQEAALSSKRLYITSEQAFFSCSQFTTSETLPLPIANYNVGKFGPKANLFDPNLVVPLGNRTMPEYKRIPTLEDHVSRYRIRHLTYPADGLDAFKGVLSRSGLVTWWGLPVCTTSTPDHPDINYYFARSLGWIVDSERRIISQSQGLPTFPTWSWLSVHWHRARLRLGRAPDEYLPSDCAPHSISRQSPKYDSQEARLFGKGLDFRPQIYVGQHPSNEFLPLASFVNMWATPLLPESFRLIAVSTYAYHVTLNISIGSPSLSEQPEEVQSIFGRGYFSRSEYCGISGKVPVTVLLMQLNLNDDWLSGSRKSDERRIGAFWLLVYGQPGGVQRRFGTLHTWSYDTEEPMLRPECWKTVLIE